VKPGAVEVDAEMEKDRSGNIVRSRKLIVIRNWPELVEMLEKAFDDEKENADFVRGGYEEKQLGRRYIRHINRRYFFRIGEAGGVLYQMFGTQDEMTFTYAYATDARYIMRNLGLISENGRVVNSISIDGPTELIEMSDGVVVTIKRDDDGTVAWAVKKQ
jgi:hypothetical protein